MNTLLAILTVTDAGRDVILAGGLYHRFPWRHLPPPPPPPPEENKIAMLCPPDVTKTGSGEREAGSGEWKSENE